jgi:uncharacterized C2H2 Zn-finger protein
MEKVKLAGDNNFLKCPDCAKVFNMEELVQNVLIDEWWFVGSEASLDEKLKQAICGPN